MLMVLPLVLMPMPVAPTMLEELGPTTERLTLCPLMDCDIVMLFEPTKTYSAPPPSTVPVVPAVLPAEETPMLIALNEAVIVEPFSPKLMLLESAKETFANPPLVVPAEKVTLPAAALGAEIITEPLEIPTEAAPAPAKMMLLMLTVPELLWVVFEVANIVRVLPPPPGAATDIESCSPAVFMVMEPEILAPLNVVPVPAMFPLAWVCTD